MKTCIIGKEQLLPSTIQKWSQFNLIYNPTSAALDVRYK